MDYRPQPLACDRSKRRPLVRRLAPQLMVVLATSLGLPVAVAQFQIKREPINYAQASHSDPASNLQQRLDQHQVTLAYDSQHGYLPAVLRELGISRASQVLVFSKTSFQRHLISPRQPRAIYFNDDSYVGWVQGGEVLEVSSIDPHLGANFYTLQQQRVEHPKLRRQQDDCLQCHASAMTENVPGLIVRSVYPGSSGMPILSAGSFRTSYQSPLRERWGGWYVTGTHGCQRHMGNTFLHGDDPDKLDRDKGANLTDLHSRFPTEPYLTPHSDIVALMVLEHQVPTHNQIILASYQALQARQEQEALNKLDGKPAASPIEGIDRRYQWMADAVLKCLLLAGEAPLADAIHGTSGFDQAFAAQGPADHRGRSLRQFDLHKRLLKYPCSYLIYSNAFNKLPEAVKRRVYERLWQILTGLESHDEYPGLDRDQRRAIYEILTETKPDLPAYWKTKSPS